MSVFFMRILLFAALFSNNIYAQYTLQYNLKVGDSIKVSQKATQDIVQDMNGSKHEMKNVLEGEYTFKVFHKTDSTYHIYFNFDCFKITTTSNLYGEMLNIDTEAPIEENDVQAKIFSKMIGAPLKMILYKNGKIKYVSGTEKMIANMVANVGISDEFTQQLMIESMKKEFGNESLARSFEQMTFIYPNKKVKVGDTWVNHYKGKLTAKNIWKLNAINDKSIEMIAESDVNMSSKEDAITMTLAGKQHTTLTAYKTSGFIKNMTVKQNTKGISVFTQMKDKEIPTTIISTTIYKTTNYVQ